ncbi:penicillin-binding transpeptidase domain-containing protein [Pararhizobium sp. IMCC21322]|uniref:penicillin-binding transpeptidase domain-containing protein n=1 Tax=Pararhizobium sp. IMCC21322 TaxID=3067903 RepID=UPI002740707D|nr:penicillin-binding transpeptidase domain-containing protein [Pararhizobium sp. IMCC21322]
MTLPLPAAAEQHVVCTLAVDVETNETLIGDGSCNQRISSASTFKIAISLMAFDSGIFTASDQPEWPFQEGYADWNPKWSQSTTPETWMRDSVVWFSQRATEKMGAGLPFGDDGKLLKGQPFDWYVGWAEKENRTVALPSSFASANART